MGWLSRLRSLPLGSLLKEGTCFREKSVNHEGHEGSRREPDNQSLAAPLVITLQDRKRLTAKYAKGAKKTKKPRRATKVHQGKLITNRWLPRQISGY